MKNIKSTEPMYLDKKFGWCADVYDGEKSNCKTNICIVWGLTKKKLEHRLTIIKKALKNEIS